jgi:hypothetical protein
LTSYFKRKGTEAKWWNWALVGASVSFALLPYAWFSHHWLGFWLRTLIVTVGVTVWSEKIDNAVVEELGRGTIIGGTIWLLQSI